MKNKADKTIEPGIYRHGKTGNLYEVLGLAHHTESSEEFVAYRPVNTNHNELFVRPYDMFVDMVEINGLVVSRFEKVTES